MKPLLLTCLVLSLVGCGEGDNAHYWKGFREGQKNILEQFAHADKCQVTRGIMVCDFKNWQSIDSAELVSPTWCLGFSTPGKPSKEM